MLYDFIIPEIFNISTIPRTTLSYRKIREKRGETGGENERIFPQKKIPAFSSFSFFFFPLPETNPGHECPA